MQFSLDLRQEDKLYDFTHEWIKSRGKAMKAQQEM